MAAGRAAERRRRGRNIETRHSNNARHLHACPCLHPRRLSRGGRDRVRQPRPLPPSANQQQRPVIQARVGSRLVALLICFPRVVSPACPLPVDSPTASRPPDLACISAKHRRLCLSPRQITQASPSSTQPYSCRHSVTTEQLHRLPRRLSGCSASKQPAQVTQANRKQPFPKHHPFQPKWLPQLSSSRGPVFFAFKQT